MFERLVNRLTGSPAAVLSLGLGARAVFGAAAVVMLTRGLGIESFGLLSGLMAVATLGGPLASGLGDVAVRRLSAGDEPSPTLSAVAGAAFVVISFGSVTVWLAGSAILGRSPSTGLFCLAVAELMAAGLVDGVTKVWIALGNFRIAARQHVLYGAARVAAAAVLFLGVFPTTLEVYAVLLLLTIGLASAASAISIRRSFDPDRPGRLEVLAVLRESRSYSLSQVTARAQADIDKAMLVRFSLEAESGLYAAGYRVLSYAGLPMEAALSAAYPKFFRIGEAEGVQGTSNLRRSIQTRIIGLGVLAGVLGVAVSPLAAIAFGSSFRGITTVVVVLAGVPVLTGLQILSADALTGAGYQMLRVRIRMLAVLVNVGLNAWLIPKFGWQGAAATTYATELVNLLILRVAARRLASSVRSA